MYFSNSQDTQLESIKGIKFSQCLSEKMKGNSQKKKIKINRNKLPRDFFKNFSERITGITSPLDLYIQSASTERNISLKKQPFTQRKLHSYRHLEQIDISQKNFPNVGKTCIMSFQTKTNNILQRKIKGRQAMKTNSKSSLNKFKKNQETNFNPSITSSKKINLIEKMEIRKETVKNNKSASSQKFQNYSFLSKQRAQQTPQNLDMVCTFGKGFHKVSSQMVPTIGSFNNPNQPQEKQIEEEIQVNKSYFSNKCKHLNKQKQQKSTQQSQIMQIFRTNQIPFSTSRAMSIKDKIHGLQNYENPQLHSQVSSPTSKKQQKQSYQKSNINKIFWSKQTVRDFQTNQDSWIQKPRQKQKETFTAGDKQKRIKQRNNNSSQNEHRQCINNNGKQILSLPRIDKIVNID